MIKYKILLTFLWCITGLLAVFSQPRLGEWTDYQSYAHARDVVDTGDKIYCVTDGGLFSYNKTDNSIQKMSGINSLSDVGVQRLAYSKENNVLVITYQNANIDLLMGNEMFNLPDIKRKQISADKTINNVLFVGDYAYLSCGFGIVVINLKRKEIKDTYFIGQEGSYVNVQDMATDGTFFYAATTTGIYKAFAAAPNLQNYNTWVKQTSIPHANDKFSKIEEFQGKIIANYTPDEYNSDEIYMLDQSMWTRILPQVLFVSDVTVKGDYIVFADRLELFIFDKNLELVKRIFKYSVAGNEFSGYGPKSAVLDDQNILWIADSQNGLIKMGDEIERIVPEGPFDNKIFSMTMNGTDLWLSAGGRDDATWNNLWTSPQFQLNREDKWTVFDRKDFPGSLNFSDILAVEVNPKDPEHVFASSWGGGIVEFKEGKFVAHYDDKNSSLQSQLPEDTAGVYVRIGGMDFDSKGNLWVTNSGVSNVLSQFSPSEGKWKSFELKGIAKNLYVGKVLVTQNDDKWVTTGIGKSIYVLNSANDTVKEQKLTAYFSNGKEELTTEMDGVGDIVEDKNGEIWVGTSDGIAVFTNPAGVWENKPMYATRPGLDMNDSFYHPLLEKESISAITIDGANRKWIGTRNSGIFLVSEDGENELEHFTTDNSPLPSNEIIDVEINQKSGEVFMATGAGLISYMGRATAGNESFEEVYVYPNPVRENYDGPIVVKGLLEDTDVKITDISGNLVFKTTSLGGQAVWDGKTLNGNRCKTGVYLVFMNDPTGENTKVTKLLFIH